MREMEARPGTVVQGPVDTEGARRATGVSTGGASTGPRPVVPDPEVPEKARRRRFSGAYKLEILQAADACSQPGEIGALLRREGLYSSHLSKWRQQREMGALEGLRPKKRGRKARPVDPQVKRIAQLERENERLQRKLEQAEMIIDVQKKLSRILGTDGES